MPRPRKSYVTSPALKNRYGGGVMFTPARLDLPGPPCKRLVDMTEAEIMALEREYGCTVKRPSAQR